MEELQKMIRQLHEQGAEVIEGRRTPRWMRGGALIIQITDANNFAQSLTVQFRDGSAGGMGFTSRRALYPPARFTVVIKNPQGGNILLTYQVLRCEQNKNRRYDIGAKLVR